MPGTGVTIELKEAELVALDRYIRDRMPGATRERALSDILAAWAAAQPATAHPAADEGLRPDELNASNDS